MRRTLVAEAAQHHLVEGAAVVERWVLPHRASAGVGVEHLARQNRVLVVAVGEEQQGHRSLGMREAEARR